LKKINNKQFYNQSFKQFGVSAQGVHWNNKYTQYKRFEILTKMVKQDIKKSTIVDAGCGFGEYYKYLINNHFKPLKYIGYDCEPLMVYEAKKRFDNVDFEVKNILTDRLSSVDYYISSGAMNILNIDEVYKFIEKSFAYSNKGFIFNILKSCSFNNIDIKQLLEFCYTLTPKIKTRDNYLDNDFTIFMVKCNPNHKE